MTKETLLRFDPLNSNLSLENVESPAILINPDAGGRRETVSPFNRTLVIARPIERNMPIPEPQRAETEGSVAGFPSSGSIDFSNDFRQLNCLHAELGIKQGVRVSHDVGMDRARWLRAKTDEDKQAVKQGIIADLERTLYERSFTAESTVTYYQDNEGHIYHPKFPGESFDVVLERGVEYSKNNNFVDCEREVAELEGWKEIMTVLFDPKTLVGDKAVSISGQGLKKGTVFTDNFVDIFTKSIDPITGKSVVTMTRFASDTSYEEYQRIAVGLDSNYFNAEQMPEDKDLDIYFKKHPIFIDSVIDSRPAGQIFKEEFKKQARAQEEGKTKKFLEQCKEFTAYYAEAVCAKFFDPEKVKEAFNAVLNKFDELRKGIAKAGRKIVDGILNFGRRVVNNVDNFLDEVHRLGRRPVEMLMVGCGSSGGFGLAAKIGIAGLAINVGTAFGLLESDSKGSLYFASPSCGTINKRPREGYVSLCQNSACPNPKAVACRATGKKEEEQKKDSKIIAFPTTTPTELPKAA